MIPHGGDKARADVIRRTFGELTSEVTGPGARTSQAQARAAGLEAERELEAGL